MTPVRGPQPFPGGGGMGAHGGPGQSRLQGRDSILPSIPVSPSQSCMEAAAAPGRHVTREEIRSARTAPLYRYVLARHGGLFRKSGQCLYLADKDGVYIKDGFPGFTDFSDGRHGNPIDFLVKYLGYGFVDAVRSLNDFSPCAPPAAGEGAMPHPPLGGNGQNGPKDHGNTPIELPEAARGPFRNMYAYLMGRGIPPELIRWLERAGLAYQDRAHNNIVFVNKEKDYCELRGTFTYARKPFHGCRKAGPDRFWYMSRCGRRPDKAYVCEAAIDAISLYLIHRETGMADASLYVSIGGVANQKAIRRVNSVLPVILAVDNDQAGDSCRKRNPDLPFIIPIHKDWNEDLQKSASNNSFR